MVKNMENIPYAIETESSYENFIAICPHCKHKNVFNRIDDLKDTNPIDFKRVNCLSEACGKLFNINGDLVSQAYKMLIFDCYALKKEKNIPIVYRILYSHSKYSLAFIYTSNYFTNLLPIKEKK